MEPFDLFTVSERIGFPALVIGGMSWGIYKVGRWLGAKLDPIFIQASVLMADHRILIKELQEHIKKNDDVIQRQMNLTETHMLELSEKLTILTELAQERNAALKDTTGVFKYMNAEIGPKSEPNLNDFFSSI